MTDEPRDPDDTSDVDEAPDNDDIFARTTYSVPQRPARREFQPWHRPRKQFVREDQWANEIAWLLTHRDADDTNLHYIGLPGADLLDVRYFYSRFCESEARELRFLGFDGSATAGSAFAESLNVSLQEVRSLPNVDQSSDVIGDDFRRLADPASIAWDRARKLAPFDIVNLDLCGHFALDPPQLDASIYNATQALLGLQASTQARPWSMFLTSRLSRDDVSPTALETLLERLRDNFDSCPPFVTAFEEHLYEGLDLESVGGWSAQEFFDSFSVGIAKWFLSLAQRMRSKFTVSSAAAYRVLRESEATDMLSIVMRFEPTLNLGADPTGLATSSGSLPTECEQATNVPKSIAELIDIDARLADDANFRGLLRDETAKLLASARYDPAEYKTWADAQALG